MKRTSLLRKIFGSLFGGTSDKATAPKMVAVKVENAAKPLGYKASEKRLHNPSFLYLLSRFSLPSSLSEIHLHKDCLESLGAKPEEIVKRMLSEGLVRHPDLVSVIPSAFGSAELKSLARERGLPVSGTKPVLAQRLVTADEAGMAALVDNSKYFECTNAGRKLVRDHELSEKEFKRGTQEACMTALKDGRYSDAAVIVANYEATRVHKRGIGIDRNDYDLTEDDILLNLIFSSIPKRLQKLSDDELLQIRIATGMNHLWGTNDPCPWLTIDVKEHVDPDVSSMTLLSHAINLRKVQRLTAAGFKNAKISGSSLCTCRECFKQKDKIYPIDAVPNVPFDECNCENGCGCIVSPPSRDSR